jgi:hypothetical protein
MRKERIERFASSNPRRTLSINRLDQSNNDYQTVIILKMMAIEWGTSDPDSTGRSTTQV